MKPEIIEFYQSKGLPIEQIIRRGKIYRGLQVPPIYEAMELVYHEYLEGKIQKDILIVWRVWQLAKTVSGKRFEKLLKTKEQLNEKIAGLEILLNRFRVAVVALTVAFATTVICVLFEVLT